MSEKEKKPIIIYHQAETATLPEDDKLGFGVTIMLGIVVPVIYDICGVYLAILPANGKGENAGFSAMAIFFIGLPVLVLGSIGFGAVLHIYHWKSWSRLLLTALCIPTILIILIFINFYRIP